jgi:hypothetical protein
MPLLIEDGYTIEATIPGRKGLYGPVTFKYRPALPETVYNYLNQRSRANSGKDAIKAVVELLGKHLVSWDLTGPNDQPVVIDAHTLSKVHHSALEGMIDHVTGYGAAAYEAD